MFLLEAQYWFKLASSVCYLRVTIDPTPSWNLHVSNAASRVRFRIASILRFGSLSPRIFCLLYTAFVLPVFDYCDVIWCPTTAKFTIASPRYMENYRTANTRVIIISSAVLISHLYFIISMNSQFGMIERVHSKFTKKLPPSCASRLSFTLTERQCYHIAIQVFKSVNNYSSSYLLNVFSVV